MQSKFAVKDAHALMHIISYFLLLSSNAVLNKNMKIKFGNSLRIFKNFTYYVRVPSSKFFEFFRKINFRARLKNKNFTIISNNCVAGVIYHLLGLRFLSPTINLYFNMDDYLKFLSDLKFYMSQKLIEIEENKPFPVGKLYDIKIYFMHYKNFKEASQKWYERAKRINWDNLIIILAERAFPLSEAQIRTFDNLTFNKKVCFYYAPIKDCGSVFTQRSMQKQGKKIPTAYSGWLGKRNFMDDGFDFVRFINDGQYWSKDSL